MPNCHFKNLAVIFSSIIITACSGQESRETVQTYTVYSTPSACSHLTAAGLGFCTNFTSDSKTIEYAGSFAFDYRNIEGFHPEWGTAYEVTVLEGHLEGKLPSYKELLEYQVTSLDPVGQTYSFNKNDEGSVSIWRGNDGQYTFLGYEVICDEIICADIGRNVTSALFELVEVDGDRKIKVTQVKTERTDTL